MFELTIIMMKRSKVLIALTLFGASASFWQCGSDPAPAKDPQDEQLAKLSQTWKATSVTLSNGGAPATQTGYDNFTLTISGTPGNATFNFSTSGRPAGTKSSPWPASGTFTFETDFNTTVKRDDLVIFTYFVTATQLELDFTYTGAGFDARTSSINGSWKMIFGL